MIATVLSIFSLLLGAASLLTGVGLLGTLLGVRASAEHFPDTITGVIMSAYFLGFLLGTRLCPLLIGRIGHIRAFAAMAAVASAIAIAHALWVAPWVWGVERLLTGICLVGLYMVIESWLNTITPNRQRGRIFGLYMTITLLAMAGGQFLIGIGSVRDFVPFALVSMLLSLALVPIVTTRIAQPETATAPAMGMRQLYRTAPLGLAGVLVAGLVNGAFWGMGAVLAHHLGLNGLTLALTMSTPIIGGALLQWPIGKLSDHFDRRRVLLYTSLAAMLLIAALYLLLQRTTPTGLLVLLFLYGGVMFATYSLSVAHINDAMETAHVLEATRGILLLYGAGAAAAPALAGVVMQLLGPPLLLLYAAAAYLLLALFALRMVRIRTPIPQEEKAAFMPMVRTSAEAMEMQPAAEKPDSFDPAPPAER